MTRSAPYNNDRRELDERQRIRDYCAVFSVGKGKDVLVDLIKNFDVMTPLDPEELTTGKLACREGQRSVIFYILNTINKDISEARQEVADHEREYTYNRSA